MMVPNTADFTVMVLDDEPMIRKLVASALALSGYRVIDAETPQHAIRLMDLYPSLDLLVTDVVMPGIGGCELAERMLLKQPLMKVLFMSGFESQSATNGRAPGSDFLQKPFRIGDLQERVNRMLHGEGPAQASESCRARAAFSAY